MGHRIITQRRGRGGSHYRSPGHRHLGKVTRPGFKGEAIVADIVHSPAHSFPVAIVRSGEKTGLMVASEGLSVGQKILFGEGPALPGNTLELGLMPEGTLVHNLEIRPGDGGKLVRAAGTSAVIVMHGARTTVRLPSGQFKEFDGRCLATVGIVASSGHLDKPFGKAGAHYHACRSKAKSHLKVRGVSMNPFSHPHGGGSHKHVGRPSTIAWGAQPGSKVGRLSPKKRRKV